MRELAGESEEELLDDEEAPRRPWVLIVLSPLLAILALWAAMEWRSGLERETRLRAELKQVYLEAESLRLQAARAQQQGMLLEQQLAEVAAEKDEMARRLTVTEGQPKGSPGRRPAGARPAPSRR